MIKKKIKLILIIILLNLSAKVFATKPCPLPPCYTDSTGAHFDKRKCALASDWVATGRIEILKHNDEAMPVMKDFLSFNFIVENWEKGENPKQKVIPFQVGWCKNQASPTKSSGLFRIYGSIYKSTHDKAKEYRYFYIEPL